MDYRKKETTVVVSQEEISDGIFDLRVKTEAAGYAKPGQFVGLFPPSDGHLLMRPISICESDAESKTLRMVYRIAGDGTKLLSGLKAGDNVEMLSLLGNGFPTGETVGKCIVLMGGGIGIPPMLGVSKSLQEENVHAFLGYRNKDTFLSEDFRKYANVHIASEDGSVGVKGNVLDALAAESEIKPEIIMACGPMPMLRAIKKYAEENQIIAYISLEERMACGVGACLGCVAKTVNKDAHSHVNNTRICTEGPVFDAREVEI